jgi:hypothetical protein
VGFGSFFKRKKKTVEEGVDDVGDMIKKEVQPENEPEKVNNSVTAEKAELNNVNMGSGKTNQLQANEDDQLEPKVSQPTHEEVTINIDSELLRRAQAKGIDISNILEQQLRRMVSGPQ